LKYINVASGDSLVFFCLQHSVTDSEPRSEEAEIKTDFFRSFMST